MVVKMNTAGLSICKIHTGFLHDSRDNVIPVFNKVLLSYVLIHL